MAKFRFDSGVVFPYHCPFMSKPFLDPLDPERLAAGQTAAEGHVALDRMPRLNAELCLSAGAEADEVWCRMRFDRDAHGRLTVRGEARVTVPLECQRCLEPVAKPLAVSYDLVIVDSEADVDALPAEMDAIIREQRLLDPALLLEEELMVALPISARHERIEDCGPLARDEMLLPPDSEGQSSEPAPGPTRRPFQVLAALKGGGKKK